MNGIDNYSHPAHKSFLLTNLPLESWTLVTDDRTIILGFFSILFSLVKISAFIVIRMDCSAAQMPVAATGLLLHSIKQTISRNHRTVLITTLYEWQQPFTNKRLWEQIVVFHPETHSHWLVQKRKRLLQALIKSVNLCYIDSGPSELSEMWKHRDENFGSLTTFVHQ